MEEGETMIIDKILQAAKPYLEGRTIKDAVLGLSLIAIELDNGDIGSSYMLREDLPSGCSVFGFAQDIIGEDAFEVAKLAKEGRDDAQRGVGVAVLTAASYQQNLIDVENPSSTFGVEVLTTDTVGMIGYIPPIADKLWEKAKDVIIFDNGISKSGEEVKGVYEMIDQPRLLPKCDVVLITGTAIINGTIDELLKISSNAREIVMVGSSTPMYPDAFKDTKVTVLAGAWWDNSYKEELFKSISLACGISHVRKVIIKKAVRVIK